MHQLINWYGNHFAHHPRQLPPGGSTAREGLTKLIPSQRPGKGSGSATPDFATVFPSEFSPSIFFLFIYYFKIWFLGEMPAIFLKDLPMCVPKWELCGLKWICFSNLANNREQIPHDLRCILTVRSCIFFFTPKSADYKTLFFSQSKTQYLLITQ